jgi:hypothetical protein
MRMRTTVPFVNVCTVSLSVDILEKTARESTLTVPCLSCGEAEEGASKNKEIRAQPTINDGVFTGISFFDPEFLSLYRS